MSKLQKGKFCIAEIKDIVKGTIRQNLTRD